MKCRYCNKEIDKVRVYSECWSWGILKKGTEKNIVESYGPVEEVTEIVDIECPFCGVDIKDILDEY